MRLIILTFCLLTLHAVSAGSLKDEFRDPPDAIKPGDNSLGIEVANLWPNRMIGDAAKPKDKRITRAAIGGPFKAGSRLLPSGLLGPVRIMAGPE